MSDAEVSCRMYVASCLLNFGSDACEMRRGKVRCHGVSWLSSQSQEPVLSLGVADFPADCSCKVCGL